ncbi:Hypothetical predicted protein [Lecanosticta acicola]|uniref:Serine hydrolase domain-containing protein n=1 Tax=Lecanosticta acicola TaxID=111012 RepID=A0AAI8Z1Y2_9PEZI|nr:Hypothetical predicted protein [Lecanosticta acicola]
MMHNSFYAAGFNLADGTNDDAQHHMAEKILEKAAPVSRRKMRVLALHGFGQSGDYLRIAMKTKQLSSYVNESLSVDLLSRFDGVEWFCPDGPLKMIPDVRYDSTDPEDVETYAWYWTPQSFEQRHEHLFPALEYLAKYITEEGPFDGIVGFSQGATIGMMLASWCENSAERRIGLATQGSPFLLPSPQSPFKFAISCCGFQGSLKYYSGFYSSKIHTPSLHLFAEFDTMVSAEQSARLAEAFEDATTIHFLGTHHVPTHRNSLYEMARFMAMACNKQEQPVAPTMEYALPTDAFSKEPAMKVAQVSFPGTETPFSSASTSPCSSLSGFTSEESVKKSRVMVLRRTTTIRRVASWSTRKR